MVALTSDLFLSQPLVNIFILDQDPQKAAQYHCDQHVVKMILESAQMLCTTLHLMGKRAPYRKTHEKHPCVLWLLESLHNWFFLKTLAEELNREFLYRYEREVDHASWSAIKELLPPPLPQRERTPFVQAMPPQYRRQDPVSAYRLYYVAEKPFAQWKRRREIPDWYIQAKREANP